MKRLVIEMDEKKIKKFKIKTMKDDTSMKDKIEKWIDDYVAGETEEDFLS